MAKNLSKLESAARDLHRALSKTGATLTIGATAVRVPKSPLVVARRDNQSLRDAAWKLLRIRKSLALDDALVVINTLGATAPRQTLLAYFNALATAKILKKRGTRNAVFTLVKDPGPETPSGRTRDE